MGALDVPHLPGDPLANSIAAIGGDDFGDKFYAVLRHVFRADLFSSFALMESGKPIVLAAGGVPRALDVSHIYRDSFWVSDEALASARGRVTSSSCFVKRQRSNEIASIEYRKACYEALEVAERLSVYAEGVSAFYIINLYRRRDSEGFSRDESEALLHHARMLMSCIAAHGRNLAATAAAPLRPPEDLVVRLLMERCTSLSLREAETCGGILLGQPLKLIANGRGVQVSSVVTYKKRAFEKLGISTRRELVAIYENEARRAGADLRQGS